MPGPADYKPFDKTTGELRRHIPPYVSRQIFFVVKNSNDL